MAACFSSRGLDRQIRRLSYPPVGYVKSSAPLGKVLSSSRSWMSSQQDLTLQPAITAPPPAALQKACHAVPLRTASPGSSTSWRDITLRGLLIGAVAVSAGLQGQRHCSRRLQHRPSQWYRRRCRGPSCFRHTGAKRRTRFGPKVVACGHGHSHDHHHGDEHEDVAEDRHGDCSHEHGHEESHGHTHGHSHQHEAAHDHEHRMESEAHEHGHLASQGHSHGSIGHSHSHGCCSHELPSWMPGKRVISRVIELCRTPPAMISCATLYIVSFFFPPLRMVGPLSVFAVCGFPLACESLGSALQLDIHVLMLVAAFASLVIGHAAEGALLLLLFATSHEVEEAISLRAQASLDALSRLSPEVARRVPSSQMKLGATEASEQVRAANLHVGDHIIVRAGEVVPVDGEVIDGTSLLGLDHLTGEPIPQPVACGDHALSGARNVDGALLLAVLRPATESTIQRIIRITSNAKASRPRIVTFLDVIGKQWSRFVVGSTLFFIVFFSVALRWPFVDALNRALAWLITASPCALLLATPLVYVCAISWAASHGVLLKGGRTLDALALATGVAFDKTGTITTGSPELLRVQCISSNKANQAESGDQNATKQEGLHIAAALGRLSVHPVSRSLARALPEGGSATAVTSFQSVPGSGIHGEVVMASGEPRKVALGKPGYVIEFLSGHGDEAKAKTSALSNELREHINAGEGRHSHSSLTVAMATVPLHDADHADEKHGARAWLFELEDRIKESAKTALPRISKGRPIFMLTGDRSENAHQVADSLGSEVKFRAIRADLSPEDKLRQVREYDAVLQKEATNGDNLKARILKQMGVTVGGLVMVGDGVNDAPALASARVGISLASQADGAMPNNAVESSDVLILRRAADPTGDSDLQRVQWTMSLAQKARQLVMENTLLALVSIAGSSIYTLWAGLPLWIGVLLHEGTTLVVALNSLRVFRH